MPGSVGLVYLLFCMHTLEQLRSGALAGKIGKYLLGLSHGQVVQVNLLLGRVFASERVAIKRLFIAQLRKLGIDAKDIQTSGVNLNAEYEYIQATQSNRFKGYRVSNQVQVKIRDIAKLGTIMDAVVTSGATNINGPSFSIDDDSNVKQSARTRALAKGKAQAESYAKANGYSSVRLLSVAEGISGRSPGPQPMMKTFDVTEQSAAVPIAPGQIGTSVVLSLQYEMVR